MTRRAVADPTRSGRLARLCLDLLRSAGAQVQPVDAGGRMGYHVVLPDSLAWHWGRPGRPCPELWLTFEDSGGVSPADGQPEGPPAPFEPVDTYSRRWWEIRALALDLGWLGVLHQVAERHRPALWTWLEAVVDGPGVSGPLPPAAPIVAWASLEASPDAPPAAARLLADGSGAARPNGRRNRESLPVRWGLPPEVRSWGRARARLGDALEQAALAAARAYASLLPLQRGRGDASEAAEAAAGPRLRLFTTMAAVIYVDRDAPWPPPPHLAPLPPGRRAAAPSAEAGPAAAPPDPAATTGP